MSTELTQHDLPSEQEVCKIHVISEGNRIFLQLIFLNNYILVGVRMHFAYSHVFFNLCKLGPLLKSCAWLNSWESHMLSSLNNATPSTAHVAGSSLALNIILHTKKGLLSALKKGKWLMLGGGTFGIDARFIPMMACFQPLPSFPNKAFSWLRRPFLPETTGKTSQSCLLHSWVF